MNSRYECQEWGERLRLAGWPSLLPSRLSPHCGAQILISSNERYLRSYFIFAHVADQEWVNFNSLKLLITIS